MSANVQETAKSAKKKADIVTVKMEDGRQVEFAGKRQVNKEGVIISNDGSVTPFDGATEEQKSSGQLGVRMDFRNGATRVYPIKRSMVPYFAIHGGKQKYGDELAGHKSDDPDDWVIDLDSLHKQLHDGENWYAEREPGVAGTSILVKALMEFHAAKGSPKTADQIKAFLDGKTGKEKEALKHTDRLRPIVQRLEEERRAKLGSVDTEALLSELDAA